MSTQDERGLLGQLKDRKVIRVALAYLVVGWVVMQVGEVTFEALGLPDWSLTMLILLVLLGFPIALVLAWAYEITPEGIRRDPADIPAPGAPALELDHDAPSIAVLPFDDLSEKGNQAYFCEGIAEEILNALCMIPNLRVASRVSAFQFGSKSATVNEIGRKLNVQTVLEGSVRKSGDQLRITAQLVKTADGYHLWSRQFDRRLADVFEIQEEIADAIARALSVTLRSEGLIAQQKVDPRAYDFFLRGLSYFAKHNIEDTVYARQMFRRALEIDPNYGRAWAGVAYTYGFEYMYFNASDVNLAEAERTSQKALELAPELAESHVSAGIANCMVGDHDKADAQFQQAVEIDPGNYEAWYFFGRAKVHEGEHEEALKYFEKAAKLRPEDVQSVLLQVQLHVSLGDEEKALEVSRKGIERARAWLELNPDDVRALNLGAFALLRTGDREEAEAWMDESVKKAPMDSIIQYNAACFFALEGKTGKALDCLENCLVKVGNISREWLENDSDLDSIRDHPRYAEIIASFPK
jgi:TolB-like protein/Flp pilus assembly protein TadD